MTEIDLPVTVDRSAVSNLVVAEDGSAQLSGVFYTGSGTEADRVTAYAGGLPGPSMVIRDAARSNSDVRDAAQLGRIAAADLKAHQYPVEQWSFTVNCGPLGVPRSAIRLGTVMNLAVYGDEWVTDDIYRFRVVSFTPTVGSDSVTVEAQKING